MNKRDTDLLDMLPALEDGSLMYTPISICRDMVNLIPDDVFNKDAKFLDIACKSGRFLREIMYRLMESKQMQSGSAEGRDEKKYNLAIESERKEYIMREQLFGLSLNDTVVNIARRNLYGTLDSGIDNIITVKEYPEIAHKPKYVMGDTNIYKILKEKFNIMADAKGMFDVVIGNPPYNKGMDLDFVDLGYKLSKKYVCMITPAKWQTAEASQRVASKMTYGEFREKLVPHMSHVVFYPDCKDVFDIYQCDGICYYLIDKNYMYDKCKVTNISCNRSYINGVENRSIINRESLWNIGNEIVKYLGDTSKIEMQTGEDCRYHVMTNSQLSGYDWFTPEGPRYCLAISVIVDTKNGESWSGLKTLSFGSNDRKECESFISYINTRFVRFLVAITLSGETGMPTNNTFRFVPAPPSGKFDHIYTDEELYKAFNLPQKYIDIIESVIKERK